MKKLTGRVFSDIEVMRLSKSGLLFLGILVMLACKQHKGELQRSRSKGKTRVKSEPKEKQPKEEWRLDWSEGFERIDAGLWTKRDWFKGDGSTGFNPVNVETDEGHLMLTLNAEPYNDKPISGAEIYSTREVAFGKLEVKMRVPKGKGIACSMITTSLVGAEKKPHDEVSIQFKGSETRSVFFNYFKRKEKPLNGNSYFLPFDASDGFHIYSIERSHRFIRWYIDGKLYYQTYEGIPGSAHRIMFSIWSSSDEAAIKNMPAVLFIDYVKYFTRNH